MPILPVRIVDIPKIIADVKALVAAMKTGDWLGDNGVLSVVQRLIGYITAKEGVGAGAPEVKGTPDKALIEEFDKVRAELTATRSTTTVSSTPDAVGDISPDLKNLLLDLASRLLEQFRKWWLG